MFTSYSLSAIFLKNSSKQVPNLLMIYTTLSHRRLVHFLAEQKFSLSLLFYYENTLFFGCFLQKCLHKQSDSITKRSYYRGRQVFTTK